MTLAELTNRRIVVPESRELDLFCRMLEQFGAATIRCPLIMILDLEDAGPVETWLRRLTSHQLDDLILLTGEGLRRIMAVATRVGTDRDVVASLAHVRTITRGPKPAKALREIGLAPTIAASSPTTEGVIETLSAENLDGRRVGVQLYPGNPNDLLIDFLRDKRAQPFPILPYRYATDSDDAQVASVIKDMSDGNVDLIAFTSSPQVKRLADVAQSLGLADVLQQGLAKVRIAAVGPVVAAAVHDLCGKVDIEPENAFHLKPLVTAIRSAFATL